MKIYFEELNSEQLDAVKAEGNILILACPGSGKTRVLTRKIAYELEKNENTKRWIIALTYTNRAADEIKRRVEKFDLNTKRLWTGTIHSFCLEWVIKPYVGYHSITKAGFTIIDEYESEKLISELKKKYNIGYFDSIKRIYNLDGSLNVNKAEHLPLIKEYKATIHAAKQIDFDDMLFISYQLLIKYPIIAKRLANIFGLVCVDEYQDTQELQYSIFSSIVKAGDAQTRMYFVGDVCQAIYGSLGGIAKTKDQIAQQFGIVIKDLKLSGNYRSNQRIIDYYSNYQVSPMKIIAKSGIADSNGVIIYDQVSEKDNIHVVISDLISNALKNGIPAAEICVMAPRWEMILPMGRKLKSMLPHVDFDAFGLSPFRKVRENIWYKVVRLFLTTPSSANYVIRHQWVAELLVDLDEYLPAFLENVDNKKRYLLRLINQFYCHVTDSWAYIQACIEYFVEKNSIELIHQPDLVSKREVFDLVVSETLQQEQFDYANDVKILKRIFNSKSGVVVSTCHGVKGEEYETVIAFGLLDGYIPNWNDPDKEASKKLLYVMCSRAKNNLYLISERGHLTRKGERIATPDIARIRYVYDK